MRTGVIRAPAALATRISPAAADYWCPVRQPAWMAAGVADCAAGYPISRPQLLYIRYSSLPQSQLHFRKGGLFRWFRSAATAVRGVQSTSAGYRSLRQPRQHFAYQASAAESGAIRQREAPGLVETARGARVAQSSKNDSNVTNLKSSSASSACKIKAIRYDSLPNPRVR